MTPTDLINIFAYFIFFCIIVFLLWERSSLIEQNIKEKDKILEELSRAIKAVISKNANEYVMTASIDKVPTEEKPAPPVDEIAEENLSDEEFFKAIGETNKADKK